VNAEHDLSADLHTYLKVTFILDDRREVRIGEHPSSKIMDSYLVTIVEEGRRVCVVLVAE